MTNIPAIDNETSQVFSTYPKKARQKLLKLRALIYETASRLEQVGDIEETLKWGEPSYLTSHSKTGSTIRLGWKAATPDQYSIYFKCTADLVPAFRQRFPDTFSYNKNRSLDFKFDDEVPEDALTQCIALALTYHLNKKLDASERWTMAMKASRQ